MSLGEYESCDKPQLGGLPNSDIIAINPSVVPMKTYVGEEKISLYPSKFF